jgi:phosphoglycolate phosphatase
MPLKLIIFDLDGTLIDSSVDITNALNHATALFGLNPLTREDTIKLIGEGITRLIEKLLASSGGDSASPADVAEERVIRKLKDPVTRAFIEHYTAHLVDHTRPYDGVRETLASLDGFRKAVISNKKTALSNMVLDQLGLSQFFEVILGSDAVPEKKPSPMPIFKVLSELRTQPVDAMIVGDSNFDIDAGKAAGIITVAATYGYRPREVIAHADYMIDSITELLPLVKKINAL